MQIPAHTLERSFLSWGSMNAGRGQGMPEAFREMKLGDDWFAELFPLCNAVHISHAVTP